jgi:hypothetical protein
MRSIGFAWLVILAATLLGSAKTVAEPPLPLGDCAAETGLADRADIVFCEPWEKPNWFQKGYASGRLLDPPVANQNDVRHASIETNGCVSGKCLKLRMKQFATTALSVHWPLRNAGLQPEQLYMRYYLKLGPTWHNEMCRNQDGKPVIEGQGGKFPGLADIRQEHDPGGQCGFGGEPGDGINCWSHRTGFRSCGGGSYSTHACDTVPGGITRYGGYIYYYQQEGATGSAAFWDSDRWGQSEGRGRTCATEPTNVFCPVGKNLGVLARERWYSLEHFIKMNTPGKADGVIRGWVDGKLAYEKTNIIFRLPGHQNLHVRTAWVDVYKGGTLGNCSDSDISLDQMVLAKDAPIGPIQAPAMTPAHR